jgi:hypothetical protein
VWNCLTRKTGNEKGRLKKASERVRVIDNYEARDFAGAKF